MMHELAVEFIKNGHQVSVLTPDSSITSKIDKLILDDVEIYRFKSGQIKNTAKLKRAINETLLSYNAWNSCKDFIKTNKHDLIVYYSPSIFFGSFVTKLKKEWNAPSYLILRDIFPQWVIDNGMLREDSVITKYFQYFEKFNYTAADRIGVMSQKNLDWFNEKYQLNDKTEILYNWASNIPMKILDNKFRKKYKLEDKVIFFYGGNIGHAQDMMNIVRLAKKMRVHPEAHFLLVGAGDEVELVQSAINQENMKNITLLPSVDQVTFKKMLAEVDIGLFTLHYDHITHNFPGKLLGYMCESKSILGSINPNNDLKDIIENVNAGYIEVNGDDDALYKDAVKLLDKNTREEMGTNANNLLNNTFSVKSTVEQIIKSAFN
jgi:glycosyltransferase involved in cell wall biosynthesis